MRCEVGGVEWDGHLGCMEQDAIAYPNYACECFAQAAVCGEASSRPKP